MKLDINAKDIQVNYIILNQFVVFRILEKIKSAIILLKTISMKARVKKRMYGNIKFFVVEIKHGSQKFYLAYKSEDKEESKWYANQFNLALKSHTNETS